VIPLLTAWIQGMQTGGMLAATAKHFPGDGMDDRDQHLCTSLNSLPFDEWMATYGKVWKAAIDAGVMAVMSGHIGLPSYQGCADEPLKAMPATLSRKLQVDLLRGELGFEGVIVSDAAPMIGMTSRVRSNEQAVQNILAGSDMFLFGNPRRDSELLRRAIQDGRISMERLRESTRRVLQMKARLGIHLGASGPELSQAERETFSASAQAMAEKSITVIRNDERIPLRLQAGAKLLTITINHKDARGHLTSGLEAVDEELQRRGFNVDHILNPSHSEIIEKADDYDCVFVNIVLTPHAHVGTVRLTGPMIMPFWRSFWVDHPNVVFTSFGSPYHLYELPHFPNMVLAYGPSEVSQAAVVRVWLGEIPAQGVCPVKLPVR